jgi:Ca2+-binding EF-hand superfamily protein
MFWYGWFGWIESQTNLFQSIYFDLLGFITINELRKVLSRLNPNITDQRIIDVLNKVDVNHDGKISYEEFVHMLDDIW